VPPGLCYASSVSGAGSPATRCSLSKPSRLRSQSREAAKIARLVQRDGPRCFYCGCDFGARSGQRRTLDHRLSRSAGGTHHEDNLRLACANCNKRKGQRPEQVFLASRWLAGRQRQVERERSKSQAPLSA
jgi:5-methylcytosine-specific restriction endonuclease McrA